MMNRYLIVKIGAIGDNIMALPLAEYIKKNGKPSHITWVVGKTASPIVKLSKNVDEIIVVDDKKLLTGNIFQKLLVLAGLYLKIGFRRYKKIMIGHTDPRYKLISVFSVGEKTIFKPSAGASHSREYVKLYDAGYKNTPLSYGVDLKKLPQVIENIPEKPFIVLSPGGAKNLMREDKLRRWPLENYVKLSKLLFYKGYNIVLIGGKNDIYCENAFDTITCISFIGKFNLDETISILANTRLFIGHDSGPMHMAALAGIPVISIYGPTSLASFKIISDINPVFFGGENLPCSPCYDGKNYADCDNPVCMKKTTPQMVFDKAVEILDSHTEVTNR